MWSTTGSILRRLVIALSTLAFCLVLVTASDGAERGKRGDYPECQKVCLGVLTKRMTELSEDYEKTGDKMLYQERVERARSDYDDCIDDCKQVIPVK
jgi:hypothetical protein